MASYVEKWGAQLPFYQDDDVMPDMMATVGCADGGVREGWMSWLLSYIMFCSC